MKLALLQALGPHTATTAVKIPDLQLGTLAVDEHKEVTCLYPQLDGFLQVGTWPERPRRPLAFYSDCHPATRRLAQLLENGIGLLMFMCPLGVSRPHLDDLLVVELHRRNCGPRRHQKLFFVY